MKLPITIKDGSAAITGLLLALCLSSSLPLWMVALGSVFAIIVVKQSGFSSPLFSINFICRKNEFFC